MFGVWLISYIDRHTGLEILCDMLKIALYTATGIGVILLLFDEDLLK